MSEKLNPQLVKSILMSDYGVVYFEKRPLRIPTVADLNLESVMGKKAVSLILPPANYLLTFLHSQPVGDKWGKDHESRYRWYEEMYREFGAVFREVYPVNNQFRTSMLSSTRNKILILSQTMDKLRMRGHSQRLVNISKELTALLIGGSGGVTAYSNLDSYSERLGVVHTFEDRTIDTLDLLSHK